MQMHETHRHPLQLRHSASISRPRAHHLDHRSQPAVEHRLHHRIVSGRRTGGRPKQPKLIVSQCAGVLLQQHHRSAMKAPQFGQHQLAVRLIDAGRPFGHAETGRAQILEHDDLHGIAHRVQQSSAETFAAQQGGHARQRVRVHAQLFGVHLEIVEQRCACGRVRHCLDDQRHRCVDGAVTGRGAIGDRGPVNVTAEILADAAAGAEAHVADGDAGGEIVREGGGEEISREMRIGEGGVGHDAMGDALRCVQSRVLSTLKADRCGR